jgi:hypothetical protein
MVTSRMCLTHFQYTCFMLFRQAVLFILSLSIAALLYIKPYKHLPEYAMGAIMLRGTIKQTLCSTLHLSRRNTCNERRIIRALSCIQKLCAFTIFNLY